ncbi:MAG: TonB family protein [Thiobacillus sp.]
MSDSLDEPVIPPRLQRPLAAAWISLGLHAAVIAMVQVAPPGATDQAESVIEARLVPTHAASPAEETPHPVPEVEAPDVPRKAVFAPSETAEALPVAEPAAPPPTQTAMPQPAAAPPAAAAPVAAITSSVDLTYYSARDLDVQPRALREIVPEYPSDADRQRLSGKVRLQLKLEADGRVSDVEIVQADPPELFNESAIRAFRDARFAPAQRNGRPVRAQVLIEVVYDWEGRR